MSKNSQQHHYETPRTLVFDDRKKDSHYANESIVLASYLIDFLIFLYISTMYVCMHAYNRDTACMSEVLHITILICKIFEGRERAYCHTTAHAY